jgi:hypothetical protein
VSTIATNVYWDRAECSVRDWKTGTELPEYQGPCLVYFDLRGPTMMYTFLQAGKRCWREMPATSTTTSTNVVMEPGQA